MYRTSVASSRSVAKQLGVLRLHAAVAAQVEVLALLGGDDAEVLALRLGALARAARTPPT